MLSKLTLTCVALVLVITPVLFLPQYLARKHCEERFRLHSEATSRLMFVQDTAGSELAFNPCFIDGELPLWKKVLILLWPGLLIATPVRVYRDIRAQSRPRRST